MEGAQRQQRIGGDLADAALRSRLGKHLREIGALEGPHVIALPDMAVTIGIEREIQPALVFQHGRKPGIVAPVGVDDGGARGVFDAEEVIDCI